MDHLRNVDNSYEQVSLPNPNFVRPQICTVVQWEGNEKRGERSDLPASATGVRVVPNPENAEVVFKDVVIHFNQ
ncbi:hypothetical protein DdX_12622 [Ditylenchus destructor]|uniref:Uncharacterized protein n=1 Tax=Ditylenchus destructor TaxID=166010 RepID=A0AAD4MV63_9BILA|nr:hypothetical protein DdX_12622 [Ditylenchus destructor]